MLRLKYGILSGVPHARSRKVKNFLQTGSVVCVKEIVGARTKLYTPGSPKWCAEKSTPTKGPPNVFKCQLPILSNRRRISDPMW